MRPSHRNLARLAPRRCVRTLNRSCLRGARRGPDELSQALASFARAIRAHRRLARLAPRFFDAAVVDREVRERAEKRQSRAVWEPLLARIYGVESQPDDPAADLPPLPGPRTRRAVERELADLDFWLSAGAFALDRYHRRRPHAIPGPASLARLFRVASALGRLACGLAPPAPRLPARFLKG